jgi:uncharacterized membrane protein (Fun14 family)
MFLLSLGGGALAGIAVGVALRFTAKLALIVTGLIILLMAGLMHAGYITVDWGAVSESLETGAETAGGFVQFALADLSAQLAGFAGGVLIGVKIK